MGIFSLFIQIFTIILFVRIILSWVMGSTRNPTITSIYQMTHQITEPLLGPIRRVLPPMGGLDFSPLILLLVLNWIQRLI